MEFDKSRVFTALNADEVKVGSKGYFADSIRILKETIKETLKDSCAAAYGEIDEIKDDSCSCRFSIKKNSAYSFFYLVKEPMEKKYRHILLLFLHLSFSVLLSTWSTIWPHI